MTSGASVKRASQEVRAASEPPRRCPTSASFVIVVASCAQISAACQSLHPSPPSGAAVERHASGPAAEPTHSARELQPADEFHTQEACSEKPTLERRAPPSQARQIDRQVHGRRPCHLRVRTSGQLLTHLLLPRASRVSRLASPCWASPADLSSATSPAGGATPPARGGPGGSAGAS